VFCKKIYKGKNVLNLYFTFNLTREGVEGNEFHWHNYNNSPLLT